MGGKQICDDIPAIWQHLDLKLILFILTSNDEILAIFFLALIDSESSSLFLCNLLSIAVQLTLKNDISQN